MYGRHILGELARRARQQGCGFHPCFALPEELPKWDTSSCVSEVETDGVITLQWRAGWKIVLYWIALCGVWGPFSHEREKARARRAAAFMSHAPPRRMWCVARAVL